MISFVKGETEVERTLAHEHRSGIRVLFDGRRSGNTMIPAGELRALIHSVHAAASCLLPTCRL